MAGTSVAASATSMSSAVTTVSVVGSLGRTSNTMLVSARPERQRTGNPQHRADRHETNRLADHETKDVIAGRA